MTIAVLKEAGPEGGKIQIHFEELLKSNTALFVFCLFPCRKKLLLEHFSDLIKFVKNPAAEDPDANVENPITATELLLYYTRLSDCIKRIVGGPALNKDLVSISSIMYEIKKYSRTF
ncbi:hypothetical protein M0R45_007218 [Rubus argutus]|uniref:Uncharacterized protein n=1 Tax=Rubus argutus TaxID=59490 RepID=A0AAW1XXS9_RUBAR